MASLWRRLLAELLAGIDSPADPEQVASEFEAEAWLIDLRRQWPGLDSAARRRAWDELADRLTKAAYATRPYCIRCGRCCLSGGPALLAGEGGLIEPGGPLHGRVYTLRAGEPVMDVRRGGVRVIRRERIKTQEIEGACVFYRADEGCTIYEDRPEQCRRLECWNPDSSAEASRGPFLDRRRALAGRQTSLAYLAAHQARCPAEAVLPLAEQAIGDAEARRRLADMVGFDLHVRQFALDRGDLKSEELNLVLGRPLVAVLSRLGWRVETADGRLVLLPALDSD